MRRSLHQKPSAREVAACLPWLEQEIRLIQPQLLVCLGATPADRDREMRRFVADLRMAASLLDRAPRRPAVTPASTPASHRHS